MRTGKGILWITCLLAATFVSGQSQPSAVVSVEKNQVLLGEVFRLRLQVQLPAGTTGSLPLIDSIPHFEFSRPPEIDSSDEKGVRNFQAVYYLSSFDSGYWVIPSYRISGNLQTDTIGVEVMFSAFDPDQPYHDIKDIIEVRPREKKTWWWLVAGAALLTGLALFYFLRKKKARPVLSPLQVSDPYADALRSLQDLRNNNQGKKDFHVRLTAIFRLYLYRRTGFLSMQQTTDDLILQLKEADLPASFYNRLCQSLRLSDFVKFARFESLPADDETCYQNITEAIHLIEEKTKAVSGSGTGPVT